MLVTDAVGLEVAVALVLACCFVKVIVGVESRFFANSSLMLGNSTSLVVPVDLLTEDDIDWMMRKMIDDVGVTAIVDGPINGSADKFKSQYNRVLFMYLLTLGTSELQIFWTD